MPSRVARLSIAAAVLLVGLVSVSRSSAFVPPASSSSSAPRADRWPAATAVTVELVGQTPTALFVSSGLNGAAGGEASRRLSLKLPEARRPQFESGLRYNSEDWLRNMLSTPRSFLLRRIKFHLMFDQLICIAILLANKVGTRKLTIPLLGHTLLGSFLGLLLVFRKNTAYSRFYEARGLWSKTMSLCRGLAMDSTACLRHHSPKSAARFATLLAAFPDALANRCLVGTIPLPPHVVELLSTTSTAFKTATTSNLEPAAALCLKMHMTLADATTESDTSSTDMTEALHLNSMAHDVNYLSDTLSGCEKIVQTPVPLSYSRHTSRFLTLWCGTLPLAIVEPLGWLALPVMATVSWLLYGIEGIGHLIEQPFVPVISKDKKVGGVTADQIQCERAAKTAPYDIGIPVCILAGQVRTEVKKITA